MKTIQVRVVYDRKKQATAKKAALIQLEVRIDGKRQFISTGIKVVKNQFKCGHVVNREDAACLNEQIAEQIASISSNHSIKTSRSYTSFIDFFASRINERPLSDGTKKQHRKVLRFLQSEYSGYLDTFAQLTLPNIIRLDDYLHSRRLDDGRPMLQTSIHTYHKVLKCYINEAIRLDLCASNPYSRFRCNTGQSRQRTILSLEEINLLSNYSTSSTLQAKVRDLFLVQCYTGLSYVDLMDMDFSASDGNLLQGVRRKTGTNYTIYLLPPVIDILRRYNYQLPHLSYDVYNRWLKAVAASAGITKTVTTHIGRHTFATTIALGSGIPIEVVSHMLGHTDIKTTQIYAKILPDNILTNGIRMTQHIT